jgi:hypothetical protein
MDSNDCTKLWPNLENVNLFYLSIDLASFQSDVKEY